MAGIVGAKDASDFEASADVENDLRHCAGQVHPRRSSAEKKTPPPTRVSLSSGPSLPSAVLDPTGSVHALQVTLRYHVHLQRQAKEIQEFRKDEHRQVWSAGLYSRFYACCVGHALSLAHSPPVQLAPDLDFSAVRGMSKEATEALSAARP